MTEQEYEELRKELYAIIRRGTRTEVIGACRSLAELEKAYQIGKFVQEFTRKRFY